MKLDLFNQGRKVSWFLLCDKIFVVYQVPKRHTRQAQLSQALCVPDRDWLNYSPNEGTGEDNVCYYAHLLDATFLSVPPGTQVFQTLYSPSPGLLNMAVSMTLAHSPVVTLSSAEEEALPLAWRQQAQNSQSGFLLSMEGPAWCAAWE